MKKVLHIIPRFTVGGAEQLILEYTNRCDKNKVEVAVASVRGDGEFRKAFSCTTITNQVFSFVRSWRPQIVHTHMLSADVVGYCLKLWDPSIRWISTQHNIETHTSFFRRMMWKRILKRADAIVAVAGSVEAFCRTAWKLLPEKIHKIYNAVPVNRFLDIPPPSLPEAGVWRIVTLGRLERQKGHDILLRALAMCADLPWRLSVFGVGSLESDILKNARLHAIEDRVALCGIGNTAEALRHADMVVQPSRFEGRSLVVMEAMAAGRCVVASDAAGLELIEHEKTGVIVPHDNTSLLAQAIRRVLTEHGFAKRLGESARDYARRHFGFDTWMKEVESLYESL